MTAWFEDDELWETSEPIMFRKDRWTAAPVETGQAVALLDVKPRAAILDLCCGPGRHSLELARRGFVVTAVDRTRVYLEKARRQTEAEGLTIEFVEADMREFCRPEAFDGVLNLFTAFGYFADPAEDRKVLANVYRSLKPGGAFVIDLMGKEVLSRIFRERDWNEEGGRIWLEERKVSQAWSRVESRWIILQGADRREFHISLRLYSAVELSTLLKECGFGAIEVYGNLAGVPYDHTASRLVVVARKVPVTISHGPSAQSV